LLFLLLCWLSCKISAVLMFAPCIISNIHFINQLMLTICVVVYLKNCDCLKYIKNTPTCFGSCRIHHQGVIKQYLTKITYNFSTVQVMLLLSLPACTVLLLCYNHFIDLYCRMFIAALEFMLRRSRE
jgi:hypothetical protein